MTVAIVIGVMVVGLVLLAALGAGGAAPKQPAPPDPGSDDPEPWTAEGLARYGTPETVADLVAQGRADELRGLGYEGDLPGE